MLIQPGQHLAHYEIVAKLGSGGMGEVYLAKDSKLDRKVALKVLPPELAKSEQRRTRFEREAKAVAALNHPNIVTVYSVEEVDGVHFFTMEMVRGKTLSELLPEKGFSLAKVMELAIPLADAVSTAHDQGIIHRDLKPDNVIVSDDGRVKVLDFGLAKMKPQLGESDSALPTRAATQEGHIMGTVAYMSPEQAEGKTVDHRSDLFSMGVLLYEMVTAQRPFRGESTTATLSSILRDTPTPVTDIRPDLPRDLMKIIRRCLEKNTEERLQTAKDLRNQLQELKGEIESGHSFEALPAIPPRRSNQPLWIAASAVTVLALAWVIGLIPGSDRAQPTVPLLTNPRQVSSVTGVESFPTWAPDGQTLAYAASESGRGGWDIWVTQIGGGQAVNRTGDHPGTDNDPAWSPDGREIAFWSERDGGGYFVMSAIGGPAKKVISGGRRGARPQWSPNGDRLAGVVLDGGEVFVEMTTLSSQESQRLVLPGRRGWRYNLSWSPDGRFFAYVDAHGPLEQITQLWLFDVDDEQPFPVTDDRTEVWSPSFSSDSRMLYYISNRGESRDLWQQRLGTDGRPEGDPLPVTVGIGMSQAIFSPDQNRLAYSRGRLVANVWRARLFDDRPVAWADAEQLTFDQAHVEYLDVSPDGTRLLIGSDRRGNPDLWMLPADGGELTRMTSDPTPDWRPRWSPDGSEIAFYSYRSGDREVWTMPVTGGPARQLTNLGATGEEAFFPTWSHDGSAIAFFSTLRGPLLVPREGGETRPVPGARNTDTWPVFSPDARWLLLRRGDDVPQETWLLSADGTQAEPLLEGSNRSRRWSMDSTRVFIADSGNVSVVSIDNRSKRSVTDFQGRRGFLQDFDIDERYLYFSWSEHLGDLWVMDVVTEDP